MGDVFFYDSKPISTKMNRSTNNKNNQTKDRIYASLTNWRRKDHTDNLQPELHCAPEHVTATKTTRARMKEKRRTRQTAQADRKCPSGDVHHVTKSTVGENPREIGEEFKLHDAVSDSFLSHVPILGISSRKSLPRHHECFLLGGN